MAEYIAGSESAFVDMMNDKAAELGMNDTTFKNCHGIDEDGHITSSYDISLMSKELLNKYPEITEYTSTWMTTLRDGESELVNTNKLIRTYEGATGLKTGSTSLALYNLSASATRGDLSLIAVVMRAPTPTDRVSNAKTLLDYGFSNYEYILASQANTVLQKVNIEKGISSSVDLLYESSVGAVVKKGSNKSLETKVTINEPIQAPIQKGDILGKVEFFIDDNNTLTTNLIAGSSIEKLNFSSMYKKLYHSWSSLLR
jgi:D-alanyl-D-alanine carboxypeptidase (penicillin-binding protein 5/6)